MTVYDFNPLRRLNSQAIADLRGLGMLRDDDRVLDATIGPERGFWKLWQPHFLTTNDIDPGVWAHHHWDARAMPIETGSFDVVTLDLPYANRGNAKRGNALDAMDVRYGTSEYRAQAEVEQVLIDGTKECCRVADRLVLVKCQDGNVASRYAPQTFLVWDAARSVGATLAAELHVYGVRKQPTDKRQLNVWSACSTLMVFKMNSRKAR